LALAVGGAFGTGRALARRRLASPWRSVGGASEPAARSAGGGLAVGHALSLALAVGLALGRPRRGWRAPGGRS